MNNILLDKNNHLLPYNHLDLTETEQQLYVQYDMAFYSEIWEIAEKLLFYINQRESFIVVGAPLEIKNTVSGDLLSFQNFKDLNFDIDCLIYGFQTDIPILYENLTFRKLYNGLSNNSGAFSISSFLKYVAINNKWLKKRYYNIISTLIEYNYNYFEINYDLFFHNVLSEGYQINAHNKKIFSLLSNPIYKKDGVIQIFIHLIFSLWQHSMTLEIKADWSRFIINSVVTRIDTNLQEVIYLLKRISMYIVNNEAREELCRIIISYETTQLNKKEQ